MRSAEHCRDVCLLDDNILLAAIIENANLLGVHSKKPMAPPRTSTASRSSASRSS